MGCNEVEELFGPYVLDALDADERRRVDFHVEGCNECLFKLQEEREVIASLAFAVPQRHVPADVKRRLMARIDAQTTPGLVARLAGWTARVERVLSSLLHGLVPHTGKALTSLMVVGVVFGGIWFNDRLNDISAASAEMGGEIESMAEREAEVRTMVANQRYLSSVSASPGVSVNLLRGTERTADAWGMLTCCAVSDSGLVALLGVFNLPPLPTGQVYQTWLIRNGQRHPGSQFTVDSTGYGQTVIVPQTVLPEFDPVNIYMPFTEFDAIGITVEPSGTSVLQGDL